MLVVVGSAPSSGSTVLARTLDRHPEIACGHELKIFSNRILYDDYAAFRRRRRWFRLFGICNHPHHEHRSVVEHLSDYGISRKDFWRWVLESAGFTELVDRMKRHILAATGKSIWAEKTPRNIRLAARILAVFPQAKVIHIIRDPRDMALSICAKKPGIRPVQAIGAWLSAAAAVGPFRDRAEVLEVRYEDLCREPESSLRRVCGFLGVEFRMEWFRPDGGRPSGLGKDQGHRKWESRPSDELSARSVGRHRGAGIDWRFLDGVRLTARYAAALGVAQHTAGEVARTYGYDVPPESPPSAGEKWLPVSPHLLSSRLCRPVDWFLGMPPFMCRVESAVGAIPIP